jgi:putative DNA primase/helicase
MSPQHNLLILEHALAWARRGYAVFPLFGINDELKCACGRSCGRDAGKHPYAPYAPHGWKNATTDERVIRSWFRSPQPRLNYAIECGKLAVIDIDRHSTDGRKAWRKLLTPTRAAAATWTVKTGGDGLHLIYAQPDPPVRSKPLVEGCIDIKGQGGYIVGVGSRGRSGKTYDWFPHSSPDDLALAPLPEWVAELVAEISSAPKPPGYYARIANGVPKGLRNTTATTLAGRLFWAGLNYTQVLEYMLFWDTKNGTPTLCEEHGEQYLIGIVDRVYAREVRKWHARAER